MRLICEALDPCDEYYMDWQLQKQVLLIEDRPRVLKIGLGGSKWLEVKTGSGAKHENISILGGVYSYSELQVFPYNLRAR